MTWLRRAARCGSSSVGSAAVTLQRGNVVTSVVNENRNDVQRNEMQFGDVIRPCCQIRLTRIVD